MFLSYSHMWHREAAVYIYIYIYIYRYVRATAHIPQFLRKPGVRGDRQEGGLPLGGQDRAQDDTTRCGRRRAHERIMTAPNPVLLLMPG